MNSAQDVTLAWCQVSSRCMHFQCHGKPGLQDIYNTMGRSTAAVPGALDVSRSMDGPNWVFPPATIQSTQAMVLMLARELRVGDALDVVARIRSRGLPSADEVPFGVVVSSPLAPDKPLTVRPCSHTPSSPLRLHGYG